MAEEEKRPLLLKGGEYSKKTPLPRETWILFFLLGLYLLRLFIIGHLELAQDEAYYWYWSKHLDLGYADHPPLVAYIMAVFTWLGRDTEFFIRLGGLLSTVASFFLLYMTARILFPGLGRRWAWEVILIFNLVPVLSAGCLIQTPDTPMLLFWAAALYAGSRIISGGPARWWYLWGCALGFGLLAKYTMILIVPCLFLFLLLSAPNRPWLFRKEPYLALLLGLLVFSPVVIWNWRHGWVSFAFQIHHGLSAAGRPVISKLAEYIYGQAGVVTPLLFLAFLGYGLKGVWQHRKEGRAVELYLGLHSWPVIVIFGLTSARGNVAEANWPAPAYLAGLMLMWGLFRGSYGKRPGHRRFMASAVALALVVNLALYVHLVKPVLPIPPRLDLLGKFRDWPGLGARLRDYMRINAHPQGYFLVSDRGTTLAEALFYSGERIGVDFKRPERYIFLGSLEPLRGRDAILILHRSDRKNLQWYEPYFEEIIPLGRRAYRYRGVEIAPLSVQLFLGRSYRGGWRDLASRHRQGGGRSRRQVPSVHHREPAHSTFGFRRRLTDQCGRFNNSVALARTCSGEMSFRQRLSPSQGVCRWL